MPNLLFILPGSAPIDRRFTHKPPRGRLKQLTGSSIGPFPVQYCDNLEFLLVINDYIGQAEVITYELEWTLVVLFQNKKGTQCLQCFPVFITGLGLFLILERI